ncbi:MAG: FABP family protein [Actinomycetota bacterium]
MGPTLHDDLQPLAFLLGTWRGEGEGGYPTIAPFAYGEEVRFWHVGKPFLSYSQCTWALDDDRPLHAEMGYWRPQPNGGVEVIMAHPFGIAEIEIGAVTGQRVELMTHVVERAPTAKEVTRVERSLRVIGGVLAYDLRMAAVGQRITHHLHAELRRKAELR